MDEALARAQALVDDYAQELFAALPEGAEIFDAHVHLGQDIDGFSGSYDDLLSINERYGISRKYAIPLLEFLDRERITKRVVDVRVVL